VQIIAYPTAPRFSLFTAFYILTTICGTGLNKGRAQINLRKDR
jgi:hypothetical protein